MTDVDWSLARSFLAIADAGSLSAAARASGASQPTLSRHLAELEAALGQRLFHRLPKGLRLTDAGAALVPHARAMAQAASRLRLTAMGREEQLQGSVRVTASRAVAAHLLPPMLAALRREEPGIQLDLVASDHLEDLLRGDADLALRMVRPEQPDVIARHIAELPIGLYAARSYLARHPAPTTLADLQQHTFIGFDRSDLMLRMMASLGVHARREDFPVRCDDQLVHWQLVRAGLGLGAAQRRLGDADPSVVRVAEFLPLPSLPVWLTAHEAIRYTPRIRRVADHLAEAFRALDPTRSPSGTASSP